MGYFECICSQMYCNALLHPKSLFRTCDACLTGGAMPALKACPSCKTAINPSKMEYYDWAKVDAGWERVCFGCCAIIRVVETQIAIVGKIDVEGEWHYDQ